MAEPIVEPIEGFALNNNKQEKRSNLFSKIGVVGCGRDGQMIVALAALAGIEVLFIEIEEARLNRAFMKIERFLDSQIETWGLTTSEKRATLSKITGSLDMTDLKDCEFVVECIRYDDETGERSTRLRQSVFKQLEDILSPEAVIATNATTVIISELSAALEYKSRCLSLHFMISHPEARIIEVVKGMYTSDEVYEKVKLFAQLIKFTPIEVSESNGLVAQRLLVVMLNEACQMLMENTADLEGIDKIFTLGFGQRVGVFRMADIIGIEKIVMLMEDMFNEYGDKRYKPSPILWRMYRSKHLGVSVNKGFYLYEGGKPIGPNPRFQK